VLVGEAKVTRLVRQPNIRRDRYVEGYRGPGKV